MAAAPPIDSFHQGRVSAYTAALEEARRLASQPVQEQGEGRVRYAWKPDEPRNVSTTGEK